MRPYKLLVVASDNFGCGKFRSFDPHSMLQNLYPDLFEVEFIMQEDLLKKCDNLPEYLKQFDLIHAHKELDRNAHIIQVCKFLGKYIVLDLDDHYQLDRNHPMYYMSTRENWSANILKHIRYADMITTTTEIYKKTLLRHNKNVEVIPNAVNPEEKQFKPKAIESERLRVGIICGSSHQNDISLLQGMVKYFSKEELKKLQFVICGFDTRGVKHVYNPQDGSKQVIPITPEETVWYTYEKILTDNYSIVSEEFKNKLLEFNQGDCLDKKEPYARYWTKDIASYATHYNNIDVLLVPLVDNDFNSVKSQLKVIEAGFFKKGIIASNFGPYTLDLKNIIGKNGILNPDGNAVLIDKHKKSKDWTNAIKFLLNNEEALETMKNNLYETVREKYSLENITEKRKEIYLNLLEKSKMFNTCVRTQ